MACACRGRNRAIKYKWTSDDGSESITYDTEIQARAKVSRMGGSYEKIG